jgi:two-component sensor histidine kinase
MFGVFLDATGRKQAEESNELLSGEMSHRVRNLLALASVFTTKTRRSAPSTEDVARDLSHKLAELGRAQDLARPVPGDADPGALLGDLLAIILAPYDDMGAFSGRIRISVPRMSVGERAATTLALVIHELATNSMKHGALSCETGTLDVSCAPNDAETVIVWTERGGPPVAPPTGAEGSGTKLVNRSMSSELGGSIEYDWSREGLIVKAKIEKSRLAT